MAIVVSEKSSRFLNSQKEKIIIAEDALFITATLDNDKNIPQGGVYFGTRNSDDVSIKYILSLLNSKVLSFIYKILFGGMHMGGGYLRYRTKFLEELPIKIISKDNQIKIVDLVEKMLLLHRELKKVKAESERVAIERQIDATDRQIDELVYKLYGLTGDEIKIVEDSFKEKK